MLTLTPRQRGSLAACGTLIGLALTVSGCGSRSALLDGSPAGGTAGSGATATGGSAGSGGSGGSGAAGGSGGSGASGGGSGASGGSGGVGGTGGDVACDDLAAHNPIAAAPVSPVWTHGAPQLTATSDDGRQITAAYMHQNTEGPATLRQLRYVTFRPFDNWPQSGQLGPAYESFAGPELGARFAVGGAPGSRLALLVEHTFSATLAAHADPNASNPGPSSSPSGEVPQFVTRSGSALYTGLLTDAELRLVGTFFPNASGTGALSALYGCASSGPLVARAVAYQGGWLMATTAGTASDQGSCPANGGGAPTKVDIWRIDGAGQQSYLTGFSAGSAVFALDVAPHPDGMWVVYRRVGAASPIQIIRVDATQPAILTTPDLSGSADVPLEFSAAALGRRLAVVWGNDPAGNPPDLVVSIREESGKPGAEAIFEPPFFLKPSIVGSPGGDSLVIGWTDGGLPSGVKLRRFDCIALD